MPCATGVERLVKQKNILFTSVDLDLDYVYNTLLSRKSRQSVL